MPISTDPGCLGSEAARTGCGWRGPFHLWHLSVAAAVGIVRRVKALTARRAWSDWG